jgi:hypothetical protein
MLTHEELFLLTLEDLRNKLTTNKEYDLIRACGLCRHLILDKMPLMHLANRKFGIKFFFEVTYNEILQRTKPVFTVAWITFDPSSLVKFNTGHSKPRYLDLSAFKKLIILHYNGNTYSIKHLIRAASHCMGGIHSLRPEDSKEETFIALSAAVESHGQLTVFAIKALCKVVLKAMEPLEQAINSRQMKS